MSNRSEATPATQAREFFSINAKFLIAPESTSSELQDDVACLLHVSLATVHL